MTTTKEEIRGWLKRSKAGSATHMLVVCDTYDYDDYPVDVKPGEDPRARAAEYSGKEMQHVMEVYALHLDLDAQLAEHRSFHYEPAPLPAVVEKTRKAQTKRRKGYDYSVLVGEKSLGVFDAATFGEAFTLWRANPGSRLIRIEENGVQREALWRKVFMRPKGKISIKPKRVETLAGWTYNGVSGSYDGVTITGYEGQAAHPGLVFYGGYGGRRY